MVHYYSVNKVILVGNITRDPEIRYTATGTAVSNFSIATNRRYKTKDGELRDEAEFHNCVAWGKTAEISDQILSTGSKVYVSGRLQTRDWTGDDGVKRYRTEVHVEELVLISGKGGGATQAAKDKADKTDKETEKTEKEQGVASKKSEGDNSEETEDKESESKEEVNPEDIPF